jgi:thymidylate kinase
MKVYKFVITGGPCGGKTTALEKIKEKFKDMDINVLVVPETASEIIGGGVTAKKIGVLNLQKLIFRLQLEKEAIFDIATEHINQDTVIIYDRGLIDGNAYIDDKGFDIILEQYGYTKEQLMAKYDAVFHIVTAALGAEEYYTLANNSARSEKPEDARLLDDNTKRVWQNHPCYRYYDNSTDFETKINSCIDDILKFISEH